MNRRLVLLVRALSISAALLCLAQIADAGDSARAFAGTYQLSNVVENGNQIHVTMTLRLLNPSTSDVKGGIVVVLSSGPNPILIGSFSAIKILARLGQVTVSKTLTIPTTEYANWQHGHAPRLQFLVPSGDTTIAAGIQAHQIVQPDEGTN